MAVFICETEQANCFACVQETKTLSLVFEIFNFKNCERYTDPVRIDKRSGPAGITIKIFML